MISDFTNRRGSGLDVPNHHANLGRRRALLAWKAWVDGAGEGNRTLVFSLEGCCSTIELHPRAADELTRCVGRLNRRYGPARHVLVPALPPNRPLTRADSLPILGFPSTTKGGDPVSYTKRCHLAGIAR